MHPLINIAVSAARSASKIIVRSFERLETSQITEKSHNDFVTDIDVLAQKEITKVIHKAYPDHAILGEESNPDENQTDQEKQGDYLWIIDPIDGTSNYIHGHPHFSISIAIKHKNKLQHGLVYDPLREELFTASVGRGAYMNNKRIRVGNRKTLNGVMVAMGISNKKEFDLKRYLKIASLILPHVAGVRCSGSAALDLAYVACGRVDGLLEMNLSAWDIAAGVILVKEAGGVVTDFAGEENYLEKGHIIAGNPKVLNQIFQLMHAK